MAVLSRIENVPTELMIKLLQQTKDVVTLSALVHASPLFHAVYIENREKILTEVTLREMKGLEITCFANWEEVNPVEVSFRIEASCRMEPRYLNQKLIELAIRKCYAQYQADGQDSIRLSIYECIALRSLTACYFWRENYSPLGDCVGSERYERRDLISSCMFLFGCGSLGTG